MKFTRYLEMLTTKETRAKMGNFANSDISKVEEIPNWLKNDAGIWEDETDDFKTLSSIAVRLKSDGLRIGNVPSNKELRVAVFPNDKTVFWCDANDLMHMNLLAYAMCVGKVPIDESKGSGGWQWDHRYALDSILLLSYTNENGPFEWYTAESYDDNEANLLIKKLQSNTSYDAIFNILNIDKTKLKRLF